MSTAIVVYSKHHGNTRKLVDAIKNANDGIKIVDITENRVVDLNAYDVIGIASGIYMGKFNYDLMEYLKRIRWRNAIVCIWIQIVSKEKDGLLS